MATPNSTPQFAEALVDQGWRDSYTGTPITPDQTGTLLAELRRRIEALKSVLSEAAHAAAEANAKFVLDAARNRLNLGGGSSQA
jgi:hypothetical protein